MNCWNSATLRNTNEQSDVDILIDREGSSIRGMFDMGGLYAELRESIGADIFAAQSRRNHFPKMKK